MCVHVTHQGRRHRRTGQHPLGGGGRPSFARMDSVCGGGVVAQIFRDPSSVGWQNLFNSWVFFR